MESGLSRAIEYSVMKKYPEETKQHVISLVSKGIPKREASRTSGVPYPTVMDWTIDIKTRKNYSEQLKKQARKLVRQGVPKCDIVRIMGLKRSTVYYFTRDMKGRLGQSGIRGKSLEFMRILARRGYVMSDEVKEFVSNMMTVSKYFPVRRVRAGRKSVWVLEGMEREAMEAMLEKMKKRSLSYQKLEMMRKAFGIKNMRRENKIGRI